MKIAKEFFKQLLANPWVKSFVSVIAIDVVVANVSMAAGFGFRNGWELHRVIVDGAEDRAMKRKLARAEKELERLRKKNDAGTLTNDDIKHLLNMMNSLGVSSETIKNGVIEKVAAEGGDVDGITKFFDRLMNS